MFELHGVSKFYGSAVAVDDVSFTVGDGEFLTLLGPSGSGKSTVLGMIAGYLSPDRGTIALNGRDLKRVPAAERGIGVVFQQYALFPHMTVAQNVAYGLKRRRWARARIRERVGEMCSLVGLAGLESRRPSQLSGGQQQRVALARALAFEPALLLMDEPLGALDQEIRLQMQEEIRRIHRELKPSVVYVTHDKSEAFALSDRIGIMRAARLVALDTPDSLYAAPESAFVASFFGGHQLLDVDVVAVDEKQRVGHVRVAGRDVAIGLHEFVPNGRPVSLAVPIDVVSVAGAEPSALELPAEINDLVHMGANMHVHCTTQDTGQRITAHVKTAVGRDWKVGDTVRLAIDVGGVRIVPREATPATRNADGKEST